MCHRLLAAAAEILRAALERQKSGEQTWMMRISPMDRWPVAGRSGLAPDHSAASGSDRDHDHVGRARPLVRDLLSLEENAILALDRKVDDPVELNIGDRLIALGELQELDGGEPGQLP